MGFMHEWGWVAHKSHMCFVFVFTILLVLACKCNLASANVQMQICRWKCASADVVMHVCKSVIHEWNIMSCPLHHWHCIYLQHQVWTLVFFVMVLGVMWWDVMVWDGAVFYSTRFAFKMSTIQISNSLSITIKHWTLNCKTTTSTLNLKLWTSNTNIKT